MENYGRKIIDYIFGKRSNGSRISYEREQKVQADSDRSDIRVFETGGFAMHYWLHLSNSSMLDCIRFERAESPMSA